MANMCLCIWRLHFKVYKAKEPPPTWYEDNFYSLHLSSMAIVVALVVALAVGLDQSKQEADGTTGSGSLLATAYYLHATIYSDPLPI